MTMRFIICLLFCTLTYAQPPILKDAAPTRYTIKSGDTLWEISSRYLKNPWEWRSLLYANPAIKNPRKLHVGAVLSLHRDNHPYIKVLSNGTVKLSPGLVTLAKSDIVPAIALRTIEPFLNGTVIFDDNVMADAPYIIEYAGQHMMGGPGNEVYVENLYPPADLPEGTTISYKIFRPTKIYFDPMTQNELGYAANLVGKADLVASGNPATLLLTNITRGIQIKDRVLLDDSPHFKLYFEPQTPLFPISGAIIDLLDDNSPQGAVGYVAVLDRGDDVGLRPGDVLAIYSRHRIVQDPIHPYTDKEKFLYIFPKKRLLRLPEERIGELMVFRVFSRTSLALIVRSMQVVHLLDNVRNP